MERNQLLICPNTWVDGEFNGRAFCFLCVLDFLARRWKGKNTSLFSSTSPRLVDFFFFFSLSRQFCSLMYCWSQNEVRPTVCLTLITCLTTNWHLSLCSLNLSLKPSLIPSVTLFLTSSSLATLSLILLNPFFTSVWGERSVPGCDG